MSDEAIYKQQLRILGEFITLPHKTKVLLVMTFNDILGYLMYHSGRSEESSFLLLQVLQNKSCHSKRIINKGNSCHSESSEEFQKKLTITNKPKR